MSTVRELVTVWGFEIDTKSLHGLEERLKGLKETAFHMGEVLLGLIGGEATGILGLGISVAHAGGEAAHMSQTLGLSTQKLQEFKAAAKLSSVEVGSLAGALRVLSLHTLNANRGNAESIIAFARAGIAVPSQFETTDKILMNVAARFHNMKDGIEKVGIATQLLGRGGAALIPFLNKGPEGIQALADKAREYGAILDDKTIKAGIKFNEVTKEGQLALEGLKNTVGGSLLPILTDLVQKILAWYAANRAVLTQKFEKFIGELVPQMERFGLILAHVVSIVWAVVNALGGLDTVFRMVLAGFAAVGTFKAIGFFFEMLKAIKFVNTSLATMIGLEAMATGGASLAIGLGAAAAAGTLTYFLTRSASADLGNSSPFQSSPFPKGFNQGGATTVYQNFSPHTELKFDASIKDPQEHAKIASDVFDLHMRKAAAVYRSGGRK